LTFHRTPLWARDLVAKADSGMMLHAAHVSPAGELMKAGLSREK
jgi:hypothetical protein